MVKMIPTSLIRKMNCHSWANSTAVNTVVLCLFGGQTSDRLGYLCVDSLGVNGLLLLGEALINRLQGGRFRAYLAHLAQNPVLAFM